VSFATLGDLIEKDTVVAGNILHLVNSALLCPSGDYHLGAPCASPAGNGQGPQHAAGDVDLAHVEPGKNTSRLVDGAFSTGIRLR
jgi:hypothetical protein